jgi:primosomal protein N''
MADTDEDDEKERKLRLREVKMKSEWKQFERKLALMEARLRRAHDARVGHLHLLSTRG